MPLTFWVQEIQNPKISTGHRRQKSNKNFSENSLSANSSWDWPRRVLSKRHDSSFTRLNNQELKAYMIYKSLPIHHTGILHKSQINILPFGCGRSKLQATFHGLTLNIKDIFTFLPSWNQHFCLWLAASCLLAAFQLLKILPSKND